MHGTRHARVRISSGIPNEFAGRSAERRPARERARVNALGIGWVRPLAPKTPRERGLLGANDAGQCGITSESPGSSPSSMAGYSAGSSRRLSMNSGTSSERFASASGPSPTLSTS